MRGSRGVCVAGGVCGRGHGGGGACIGRCMWWGCGGNCARQVGGDVHGGGHGGSMHGRSIHGGRGLHGKGAACVTGEHAWQGGHAWQRRGCVWQGGLHGMHVPSGRCYEIQSMSGRYA